MLYEKGCLATGGLFYALEILANPKNKALGGVRSKPIPVVDAEDGKK
ncbi:hypothetical protein [Aureicoccus marinus]|nr:hypothetical protein [Aureicoccus marinus]